MASQHAAENAAASAELEVEKLTPLVQNKVVSDYQLKTAKAALEVTKPILNRQRQCFNRPDQPGIYLN